MTRGLRGLATVAALGTALCAWDTACAQRHGGILRMYSIDSPASMSILEEATAYSQRPMMGVFNNLASTIRQSNRTLSKRSCLIWPPAGHGVRTAPN